MQFPARLQKALLKAISTRVEGGIAGEIEAKTGQGQSRVPDMNWRVASRIEQRISVE